MGGSKFASMETLELLVRYAEALQPLRGLPLPDPARFPNGM